MDHRIFGKEITNILDQQHLKNRRNYSFLHADRLKDHNNNTKHAQHQRSMSHMQLQKLPDVNNDPQMVPQYFHENLQFMREQEKQTHNMHNYILHHKTVSQQSRAKLIDWLSQLHFKYKMFPETLFTIVSLIDTHLANNIDVPLTELQLVGVSALFIAAKFEQTYQVPQLKQLVACCAHQYSEKQILEKEADIIKQRNFELIIDSVYKFFEPLAQVIGLQPKNKHLAQYVLQLALLQPKFLNYSPSLMASAVIYLIKKIRKSQSSWNDMMTSMVGYKEQQLKTCAKQLCSLLQNAPELQNSKAIKKKFSSASFHEVTKIKLQRKEKK